MTKYFLGWVGQKITRMDLIFIKLSHLGTGCCFPQLHATTWWKMNMSLDYFHRKEQPGVRPPKHKNIQETLRLAFLFFLSFWIQIAFSWNIFLLIAGLPCFRLWVQFPVPNNKRIRELTDPIKTLWFKQAREELRNHRPIAFLKPTWVYPEPTRQQQHCRSHQNPEIWALSPHHSPGPKARKHPGKSHPPLRVLPKKMFLVNTRYF